MLSVNESSQIQTFGGHITKKTAFKMQKNKKKQKVNKHVAVVVVVVCNVRCSSLSKE